MNYDDILEELGEFGRWQQIIEILLWIPLGVGGVHVLMYSFTGLAPSKGFRCRIPGCDNDTFSFDDYDTSLMFPSFDTNSSDYDPDSPNYCRFYMPENQTDGTCSANRFDKNNIVECQKGNDYTYAPFEFSSTIVTELDLVCGDETWGPWIGSAYMFGLMIGSFVAGIVADRYGRKIVLFGSIIISSGASLAGAFIGTGFGWYWYYLFTRVLVACGGQGIFLAGFSLSVELVGMKERVPFLPWVSWVTFIGNLTQAGFAMGETFVSIMAMLIPHWSTLQWVVSAITFLQLGLWFALPESPRWLIANNKHSEVTKILEKAAKRNKTQISPHLLQADNIELSNTEAENKDLDVKQKQYGFKDLFSPTLRMITIVLWIVWPVVTLGYYGISFYMANLEFELFTSFIISSLIEIPAYVFALCVMDVWGRKPLMVFSLIFSGAFCIICSQLDPGGVQTGMAFVGKFMASASFSVIYMYTAELYPTVIRSTGIGMCSVLARIGAISAPQIALNLPKVTTDWMPFMVMGVVSTAGGLLSLALPETTGYKLPETMEDIEYMKKNSKPIWKCVNPMKK